MSELNPEQEIGKVYDWRLIRRLLGYARPYTWYFLLSIVLLMLITAADLAQPYLLKIAIDDHLTNPAGADALALTRLGLFYLIVILAGFGLNYWQTVLLQHTGQKVIFNLRRQLFAHLQKLSLSFFDRNPVGRLVTRITNDTEALNEMYTSVLVTLFKDVLLLAGIVLIMLRMSTYLALVAFVAIPLLVVAAMVYQAASRRAYRRVRVLLAAINSFLQENLSGIRVIQAFNRESHQFQEFQSINSEYYRASLQELRTFALFRPAVDLIYSLSVALLVWYGGAQVVQEVIQFGVLYAFIAYTQHFFRPINDLSEKYSILQGAMAAGERIFHLLDTTPEITDPLNPVDLPPVVQGEIEFRQVWFAYNQEDWVLRDLSFSVRPGETVALVGATGAGKTSVISLLMRFYDPQRGSILLDGLSLSQLRQQDLRRQIGIVLQDAFLFAGSIQENISLNDTRVTDEAVRWAAGKVQAADFIKALPHGYEDEVPERGATLSSGQRQLLAFARALVRDPAVLILDEATASIDPETENKVQEALQHLTRDRTTIIIAHRLSTLRLADRILVLHNGRLQESGRHDELLARRGLYYRFYRLQQEAAQESV